MKERPMMFNAEMVRAILDGRKTQTRRLVPEWQLPKHSPDNSDDPRYNWMAEAQRDRRYGYGVFGETEEACAKELSLMAPCPFGNKGDRIWVRETFACLGNEDGCAIDWNDNLVKGGGPEAARIYRASCEQKPGNYGLWSIPDDAFWKPHTDDMQYEGVWVPSIHMPRWASRITLEITGVRVERLNEISQADAIAEGAPPSHPSIDSVSHQFGYPDFSRSWFGQTWQHIYGEESWKANPWVWVIEFKRIEAVKGNAGEGQ